MKALLPLGMMVLGNVFMTTAWYWHLRRGAADGKPLLLIVLMSWGIALLEYLIMVPANRLGAAAGLSVAQLKVAQEVITLLVFVPFAYFVLGEKLRLDYLWQDIQEHGETELFSQSDKAEPYERERPASRTYTATNKSYQAIIKQLTDLCPPAEEDDPLAEFR